MSSVNYLSLPELLFTAERTLDEVAIRDVGLLESALTRPQATAFGADAYPTIIEKAASLVHSLGKNHALVDGNKRLALAGLIAFLGVNGMRLHIDNDRAFELISAIAAGSLDDVTSISAVLAKSVEPHTF